MPLTKGTKKVSGKQDDSPEPGSSKRDKYSSDEDEQPVMRKGKSQSSKMSKQGKMSKRSPNIISKASGLNTGHNKPAELFRKDLISAMKLADTEILYESEYLVISDPWRQEWEKGVQVPVNEEEIPPSCIKENKKQQKNGDFKLPLRKYLHEKIDETYQQSHHELTGMQELAEQIVRYDLDDQDVTWLELVNQDREEMGLQLINEWNMERMIEELENQCYVKTNALKKTEEGLGIEYDEDVACDVCRMLESEDTNEMVFCDGCDICVHQACYGIQTIPEGSWLCRICALGIKPMCLLCPKRGGAMKSTKSGTKWTHVSCALWIPEVSIGCPEKMEPVTKISNIPPSRWALVCNLCKERVGACIQCSVKQCKTAFHVTCGFAHNLDMKTIVDDSDDADGIHLRAFCPKHTKNRNASDSESPKKDDNIDTENEVSEAEMAKKRQEKLQQIEDDFYHLVDIQEIAEKFFIPEEAVDVVTEYWKLKRKVNNNKPLITPKMEEEDQMQKQQKDSLSARMKMFVHLRQDLERARNLCYMISKREKTKRQFFKLKESVFRCQVRVLTDPDLNLGAREAEKIRQDYHFSSLYSNYGVLTARNFKQPRENLFTLENLKTPKDYTDSAEDHIPEREEKFVSRHSNLGKEVKGLRQGVESSQDSESVNGKSEVHHRDSLFSVDSFALLSDTTVDSSEDESLAQTTHSSQMSRLGKVRLKEIEDQSGTGGSEVIKTVPVSPTKKNFVPTSDLGKKLSLFLQSKTKMQQQKGKNMLEKLDPVLDTLHIDVEHSDVDESEVFTSDTNTNLTSPADQPRNLFDQFGMQDKNLLSSPEIPQQKSAGSHREHKKVKRRKHSRSQPKIKKLRLVMSPSDQSNSSVTIKTESSMSNGDVINVEGGHQLDDSDTIHLLSSPKSIHSDADFKAKCYVHSSSNKGRKKKSRRSRESSTPDKSSKLSKKLELSPSPRVKPDSVYATLDGDIYVPSGKILVTERTIVLDNPKVEDSSKLRSKLRLKKQANSPVKGLASYIVVKDEDEVHPAVQANKEKPPLDDKNIFDRVLDPAVLKYEASSAITDSELPSRQRNLRGRLKNVDTSPGPGPRTRQSKLTDNEESKSSQEVKSEVAEKVNHIENNVINVEVKPAIIRRRTQNNEPESGETSDENFQPKSGSPKVIDRSSRPRRLRNAMKIATEDDSDDFIEGSPQKRRGLDNMNARNAAGRGGIKLASLPNKPELNALLDSSKLIIKDQLRKDAGDKLSRRLKQKGRWGGGNGFKDNNQSTLDKFFTRTSSSENVFSKPDISLETSKRSSLQPARSDLSPLRVNQSSSINSSSEPCEGLQNSLCKSSLKHGVITSSTFGSHTSSLSSYRIPRKSDSGDANKTSPKVDSGEVQVFGDVHKLVRPLSFEDVSENSELLEQHGSPVKGDLVEIAKSPIQCEVVKTPSKCDLSEVVRTPSKCDLSELSEDKLDGNRSYRSQSPQSSEGSTASRRMLLLESRETTPNRRITRSCLVDDSPSPSTRLRKRESLLKAPQLKL
ncbi:unnamed protein product [Lymnaea stagnalis]|uniref:Protein Jade-1 n=1 Tax=Lymnaea stagnalis TaxID=6523 RepID=A0AAV2HDI4_LYMST